ncbi:MAG: heavy metal-responsive transcriptional regulator [Gammaproteobacteria bacterium]|nr:MAG: heavy metal-responsive transcriptional regulator [Gammaproteobacteria bacterium]
MVRLMRIGELAKKIKVSIDTVRYYEQRGLLPRPSRSQSGYRQYSSEDIRRLRFIVQAKELGFTLEEIKQLLALRTDGRDCEQIKGIAEKKAKEITGRIEKLSNIRTVLKDLASQCDQGIDEICPILRSLEGDE